MEFNHMIGGERTKDSAKSRFASIKKEESITKIRPAIPPLNQYLLFIFLLYQKE